MEIWLLIMLAATVSAVTDAQLEYRFVDIPSSNNMQTPTSYPKSIYPAQNYRGAIGVRAGIPAVPAVPVPSPAGAHFPVNLGAGIANFDNGPGATFDALVSGSFNADGVLISGLLGSGAKNTPVQNFNNKPPPGAQVAAPPAGGEAPAPGAAGSPVPGAPAPGAPAPGSAGTPAAGGDVPAAGSAIVSI